MPNINDAFPSKYLKASDLQGQEPVVTMDRVEFEPVGHKREMKGVLYFVGKDKGLVLNKTNATKIIDLSGTAITEEWNGVRIRLYATETTFGGDTVDCIRIKPVAKPLGMTKATPPKPKPAPPPVESDDDDLPVQVSDDEIPF
jgi:hypothetical protein